MPRYFNKGYVKKVAADSLADIGGAIVTLRDSEPAHVEKLHFRAARGPTWRP